MTYNNLNDFNSADLQASIELIPANTLAKVVINIKPGGYGPEGWMTRNQSSGATYLNSEFIILEGPYAKRRVYTLIGIKGTTTDEHGNDLWANRGRSLIRAILESARNIDPKDQSDHAQSARRLQSLGDLNGLEFAVKIGIEHNKNGSHPDKNKIAAIVTPDHKDYRAVMGQFSVPSQGSVAIDSSIPSWIEG